MAMNFLRTARQLVLKRVFVGLIFGLACVTSLRAQNLDMMNWLRVRFDTVTIKPDQGDIFVNVSYTYHLPKQHNIHAYDLHFYYEQAKTSIVQFIFDGTATPTSGSFLDTNQTAPDASVVFLGSNEIDLTNPVLFKVWFFNAGLVDSETLRWDRTLSENAQYQLGFEGLDTIILEDGWIKVQQPSKIAVAISTPAETAAADSMLTVPVTIGDLTGANLLHAKIGFVFDTSVLQFAGVIGAESGITAIPVLTKDTLDIDLRSSAPMRGGDSLITLQFHAVKRMDTVTTRFSTGIFTALNSDALLGNVQFIFNPIRIEGESSVSGVGASRLQSLSIEIFPNPAAHSVRIQIMDASPSDRFSVGIFDALGREVFRSEGVDVRWTSASGIPNGMYEAVVTSLNSGFRIVHAIAIER
jgi:hypothetical protein